MQKLLWWEAEDKEMMEKRCGEEAVKRSTRKRRKGGVLLRTGRIGRKSLSVHAERKAAMEENLDALRKGKWPHCTQ